MRTLKSRGMDELSRFRQRLRRQRALGRVRKADADYIEKRLDEIEARVVQMPEINELGEEEGWDG